MSGWEVGAKKHIGGKGAMAQVQLGEGQVVLFGFRPQFRGQPRGTYKLIFNALYASTMKDLPGAQVRGRWRNNGCQGIVIMDKISHFVVRRTKMNRYGY